MEDLPERTPSGSIAGDSGLQKLSSRDAAERLDDQAGKPRSDDENQEDTGSEPKLATFKRQRIVSDSDSD